MLAGDTVSLVRSMLDCYDLNLGLLVMPIL